MSFFNIKKSPEAVQLVPKEEPPFFELIKVSSSVSAVVEQSGKTLYFLPQSLRSLDDHIGWGTWSRINNVEQGGILVGEVFYDDKSKRIFGIIQDTIPGKRAPSSGASLNMTTEVWNLMLEEYDNKYKDVTAKPRIIGWYHTHPNELKVFMSNIDTGTQQRFFKNDWQFAVVMNPQRRIWKAYSGEKCKECQGYFLLDNSFVGTFFDPNVRNNSRPQQYCSPNDNFGLNSCQPHAANDFNNNFNNEISCTHDVQYVEAENSTNSRKVLILKEAIQRISKSINCCQRVENDKYVSLGVVYEPLFRRQIMKPDQHYLDILDFTPSKILFWFSQDCLPIELKGINIQSGSSRTVRLIVVFSNILEIDIGLLRQRYRDFQFLLWINLNSANDFHFYDLL